MKALIIGSTGQEVKEVQKYLFDLGYLKGIESVAVDGIFGQNTMNAVQNFQRENFVNGKVDEATFESLKEKFENSTKNNNTNSNIRIIDYTLQSNEYFAQEFPKHNIFLHLTAGNRNAYFVQNGWEHDNMSAQGAVGTAYIVSGDDSQNKSGWAINDGQVLRVFDDKFWAYHTGTGIPSIDQTSVAIEICNWGSLTQRNGRFFTFTGEEIQQNEVEELEFRGLRFWHKISDKQLESLRGLLKMLLDKYPKVKENYQNQLRNNAFTSSWSDFKMSVLNQSEKGIVTHTNVIRPEARLRWDIPPFARLLEVLKSL
jgi:peptidoglycan hydrolase-like protein with peptidoglycan-binding domain